MPRPRAIRSRVFKGDLEVFGTPKDFPYVATTYRLTEHFHFWTQHSKINAVLQPEHFVEIGEELARRKASRRATRSRCAPTGATSRPWPW